MRHRLLLPASLASLLVVVLFASASPMGLAVVMLLSLGLAIVVRAHRRLRRSPGGDGVMSDRSLLRTPSQVALAVLMSVVFGGFAAVFASIAIAAATSSLAGDGNEVVRLCMGLFVLIPCIAVGSRCGRWWAFLGAAGLVPVLALSVLASGGPAERGLGLGIVAVLCVAFAVATGSLEHRLAYVRPARNRADPPGEPNESEQQPRIDRTAVSARG
jgi:hypothetical protein